MTSHTLKTELHQELKLRYNEFFESQLAVTIVEKKSDAKSIAKISAAIIDLLEAHADKVKAIIEIKPEILKELSEPYYGASFASGDRPTTEAIYKKMLEVLRDATSLKQMMQIYGVFIHRIYDALVTHPQKPAIVKKLFANSLFSTENRSRSEHKVADVKVTQQQGICLNPVFAKKVSVSDSSHSRALDRYQLNPNSLFSKAAKKHARPTVCGASGHTGSFMLGATLYGMLEKAELKEYALICFAFLTAGGNHSFDEAMVVAGLVGVDFKENDYAANFHDTFLEEAPFEEIRSQFSSYFK